MREEPFAALFLVQNIFQLVTSCGVPVIFAYRYCIAYHLLYAAIIFHQDPNDLSCRHDIAVVVFYGLELTYVTDASYGRPAHSSDAFRHYVN
jgi:hypothetical protein